MYKNTYQWLLVSGIFLQPAKLHNFLNQLNTRLSREDIQTITIDMNSGSVTRINHLPKVHKIAQLITNAGYFLIGYSQDMKKSLRQYGLILFFEGVSIKSPDELKAPELSELGTIVAYYHDARDGPKLPMNGVRIIYKKSPEEVTQKLTDYFSGKGFRESKEMDIGINMKMTYYSISFEDSDSEQPIVRITLIYDW